MTFQLWFICVLLLVIVGLLFLIVHQQDQIQRMHTRLNARWHRG